MGAFQIRTYMQNYWPFSFFRFSLKIDWQTSPTQNPILSSWGIAKLIYLMVYSEAADNPYPHLEAPAGTTRPPGCTSGSFPPPSPEGGPHTFRVLLQFHEVFVGS